MSKRVAICIAAFLFFGGVFGMHARTVASKRALHPVGDHFELDGKRLQILSGAIYYVLYRVPIWQSQGGSSPSLKSSAQLGLGLKG